MPQTHRQFWIATAGRPLVLGPEPVVMGILNVTPDSFSDGGDHLNLADALAAARHLYAEGAAIIDVGGESTRPGATPVPVQDELDRVMPILDALADDKMDVLISIDTRHALVADQAIQAGAHIINTVEGLQADPDMAAIAAAHNVPVIAMHWEPERDRNGDIIADIKRYFERTIAIADKAELVRQNLILDPGFGFAKDLTENYEILRRLPELTDLGLPLLVGTSRKGMIGKILDNQPKDRLAGTIATSVLAYLGGAHIFRVHDIKPNRDALRIARAALYGPPLPETHP